jgi:hypothetical protein
MRGRSIIKAPLFTVYCLCVLAGQRAVCDISPGAPAPEACRRLTVKRISVSVYRARSPPSVQGKHQPSD